MHDTVPSLINDILLSLPENIQDNGQVDDLYGILYSVKDDTSLKDLENALQEVSVAQRSLKVTLKKIRNRHL